MTFTVKIQTKNEWIKRSPTSSGVPYWKFGVGWGRSWNAWLFLWRWLLSNSIQLWSEWQAQLHSLHVEGKATFTLTWDVSLFMKYFKAAHFHSPFTIHMISTDNSKKCVDLKWGFEILWILYSIFVSGQCLEVWSYRL